MRIAILGATSQIAKDLVRSLSCYSNSELVLFARQPDLVNLWLASVNLSSRHLSHSFEQFEKDDFFDAILNFVGIGNPVSAKILGAAVFNITCEYDDLAMRYIARHPNCRYIFMSSGAVYGSIFEQPAHEKSHSIVPINQIQLSDWYSIAKLHAECRHRALPHLHIIDLRIFNYFSHTQDMDASFLMCEIVRALRDKKTLMTGSAHMVRDYIDPYDFYQLIQALLSSQPNNLAFDCYSRAPVDKITLLEKLHSEFSLDYSITQSYADALATGQKPHYYSISKCGAQFGYQPRYCSLDTVVNEMRLCLTSQN